MLFIFEVEMSNLDEEESALDREINAMQDELLKLAMDKRNLEIAIQTMLERERIDKEYFNSR